jgi:hypothetical protein
MWNEQQGVILQGKSQDTQEIIGSFPQAIFRALRVRRSHEGCITLNEKKRRTRRHFGMLTNNAWDAERTLPHFLI